ncbi:MAG: ferritin family protein [Clostridia bacterium]|nr:ferritin family protein [Clostridia bacterium]
MEKLKRILNFAMRMEKDAGDFYAFYMDKASSPATRELFHELAETEKQHYSYLKNKYDELGFEDPPIVISWVVDNNFSSRDPHILSNNSDLSSGTGGELSDLSIIRMAYLIESDFALFYKKAMDVVEDDDARNFLNSLAQWEEQHKTLFHEKYQKLLKDYWSDISSIIFPD